MIKKQENPIGYRPSEDMKKIFEKYCADRSRVNKSELVEIAMRFFAAHGEEAMKEIISKFIFGDSIEEAVKGKGLLLGAKRGEHKKTA